MKNIFCSFFAFCSILISAQGKRFFENGEVQLRNPVEKINLNYANELPFVKVTINGKIYNFLFDSGAPTVISQAIYKELNLEKKHRSKVKDSQKNKHEQIFTELPEMTIDHVVFKKIGAIVLDLSSGELGCLKVDGLIGANQMAKLFWRINYSENSLEATKDLSLFDLSGYDITIPFLTQTQKTPMIETEILDKNIKLTFDTGASGRLRIADQNFDSKKATRAVETFGTSAVGAFGAGKPIAGYIFRAEDMTLGNKNFPNQLIATGGSDLIGNEFFKDFAFIFDWKNSKIYMKRIRETPAKLETFGFSYRFIDLKPVVTFVFKEDNFPLKIGDSIISINNINLENLDQDGACHYTLNRIERDQETIDIKIKRDGKILDVTMKKKEYLQ